MLTVTAIILVVGEVLKLMGYAALAAIAYFKDEDVCSGYCMVLAAEVFIVSVAVWAWLNRVRGPRDDDSRPAGGLGQN